MNSQPPRETALRTYFHLTAYGLPLLFFTLFAQTILFPRIETIWERAGERAAKAQWVINLCRGFFDNFYFVLFGLALILGLLESFWSRWPAWRSSVIRTLTWSLTICVLSLLTWTGVAAGLAVPMVLKPDKAAQTPVEPPR
jgi:hypothetical protein